MAGDSTRGAAEAEYTPDELRDAEAAHNRWWRGSGPAPTRRQREARNAARRLRSYGALPPRQRDATG